MGWGATEQDTLLLAESWQNVSALHCNRNPFLKGPSGKPYKCPSRHSHQSRACPIFCANSFGLCWTFPAHREAPHLWNSISTALSCSFHPAVGSGEAARLCKKEYFVSGKKMAQSIQPAVSHELAKETISLLQGILYLDDKLLWLNCFRLPSCISLLPVYLHCCTGENYGKLQ